MSSPGGWLRGVIKEVPSGDTLIIMGQVKGGPPPEKRITLSSLVAPKLGRRDGSSRDEPFAWQSREFLRKKTIGQPCVFRIDYKVEGIAREFGSVFIGQSNPPENVAFSVVAAGWAKVRGGHQQSPFIEELDRLQEQAIENQVGMHTKDPEMLTASVRDLPCAENGQGLDAMELLSTMGKGKPLPAIVEQVLNGTTLRVLLLPSFHTSTVMVCGLQSPSMGRRDPGNPEAEPTPEPFAREAKHFAECRILNREVRVVLEGVDKYNNLFGTVKFVVNDEPVDFGEQIVAVGLAKVVDWSLAMMTTGATRLREGERAAKQARAAIWHDYVPPPTANTKVAGEYKGKVLEVISGDMVVVKDPNGTEHKISLASIRAPRMGRREDKPEPYAVEAKDFVRRNIIGREVHVKMEYDRKIGAPAGKPGAEEQKDAAQQIMHFGSITFQDAGQDGQIKTKNIAEMLVERGLAVTQSHRGDDERSVYYDSYMEAENRAKKSKKGVQGNLDKAPPHRYNDVSIGAGLKNAKQYLPFFQRAGRLAAVVDFVLSGHRFKLHIPKEGVQIAFSPSGVKTPNRAQGANPALGKGPVAEEPYAQEAFAFVRESLMQRDVEVQIDNIDKGGTFLGSMFLPGLKPSPNVGVSLLLEGLAKLHPTFAAASPPGSKELIQAEESAKEKRLKVWEDYQELPQEDDSPEGAAAAPGAVSNGSTQWERVTVTEVSGTTIYVQRVGEPRVAWLEEQLSQMTIESGGAPPIKGLPPKRGDLCVAQFSLDKRWYRAFVERVEGSSFDVSFIDFGNTESVPVQNIRGMEPALSAVPAQAQPCELAYVKVPGPGTEYGPDAAGFLADVLGGGRPLQMMTVARERPAGGKNPLLSKPLLKVVLYQDISEGSSSARPPSVNEEILAAGLAKVARVRGRRPQGDAALLDALEAAEKRAKDTRAGMWQYGDPGDSDDEEEHPRPSAWGKKR